MAATPTFGLRQFGLEQLYRFFALENVSLLGPQTVRDKKETVEPAQQALLDGNRRRLPFLQ